MNDLAKNSVEKRVVESLILMKPKGLPKGDQPPKISERNKQKSKKILTKVVEFELTNEYYQNKHYA